MKQSKLDCLSLERILNLKEIAKISNFYLVSILVEQIKLECLYFAIVNQISVCEQII